MLGSDKIAYSYLIDDGSGNKNVKETKKCLVKKIPKFEDYKKCLQDNKIILKLQQRLKNEARNVFTEEINKLALSSNDEKR